MRPAQRRPRVRAIFFPVSLLLFLFFFSNKAVPEAEALTNPCALDPNNIINNGSMAAANPDLGIAYGWYSFVLNGDPVFEHVTNEQIDPNGSQYLWQDGGPFDAGIYQTVTGLTPLATYRFWLGYALAAYDDGSTVNKRGDWIGRQIGIDYTGGTDPLSPNVSWGNIVWNGIGALNIPDLANTFIAPNTRATFFLRAINTVDYWRNKVWFDSVCMERTAPPFTLGAFKLFLPVGMKSTY